MKSTRPASLAATLFKGETEKKCAANYARPLHGGERRGGRRERTKGGPEKFQEAGRTVKISTTSFAYLVVPSSVLRASWRKGRGPDEHGKQNEEEYGERTLVDIGEYLFEESCRRRRRRRKRTDDRGEEEASRPVARVR